MQRQIQSLDLNPVASSCQHRQVHEIGEDFDKEGRLLRLARCQRCGLLMHEYLPMLQRVDSTSHGPRRLLMRRRLLG